jgi:peptide chain release factor 1
MDRKLTQDLANRRAERRDLVQTADRSAKIRTYNYVQVRLLSHALQYDARFLHDDRNE